MIASPSIIEYQKLKDEYLKLSSFIRSLQVHTESEDLSEYKVARAELDAISIRLDKIITEMDAFEQVDLKMDKKIVDEFSIYEES
tara:strand:- start:1505 stop:1759 length:255 start_codon:yes stop_codon:yes gene_type:complete